MPFWNIFIVDEALSSPAVINSLDRCWHTVTIQYTSLRLRNLSTGVVCRKLKFYVPTYFCYQNFEMRWTKNPQVHANSWQQKTKQTPWP
jgi:hypothetical protein